MKAYILKESALIGVYKSIRQQFQRLFCLDHQTHRHSPPLMKRTFEVLQKYLQKNRAVEYIQGRDVKYSIPNVMAQGIDALLTLKVAVDTQGQSGGDMEMDTERDVGDGMPDVENVQDNEGEDTNELDDEEQEVEDDGDLDAL